MNEFEQWQKSIPLKKWQHIKDEEIFSAGMQAERERLRKLVEAEVKFLGTEDQINRIVSSGLKLVLNWLTDPTETDKNASND